MVEERYDFVSLGAGIGGITGALRADSLGLSTLILEKSDQVGGTAAYSSGQQWVAGSYLQREAGLEDTWQEGFEFLTWLADGSADPYLLEKFCRTAPEVYDFLGNEVGVRWCIFDLPDAGWPDAPGSKANGRTTELEPFDGSRLPEEWRSITRHSPYSRYSNEEMYHHLGGLPHRHTWDPEETERRESVDVRYQGSALAAYLVMGIADRGIPMHVNVDVRSLIIDEGRVIGVIAVVDGEERRILADKALLVATGGYDWNLELIKRFDGRDEFGSRSPRSITGDHFRLLESLEPELATFTRPNNLGYLEPASISVGGKDRWQTFYTSYPHCIVVNRSGSRFKDESLAYIRGGNALLEEIGADGELINMPCFAIFDSQYHAKYPIGVVRPGEPLPDVFVEAPTIRDLADKLGIDADSLEQTIDAFNEAAAQGADPAFDRGSDRSMQIRFGDPHMKPNPNLGSVEDGPFYGVSLTPVGVALTQTGMVVDEYARIINTEGQPIPGLYAVGNAAAYVDVGCNYHGGIANTRGMTWAYVAAQHAGGRATSDRPQTAHA